MGGTKFFSTEEKCYLMGWGEYGVKSKDIVPRVVPSQRAENVEDAEGEHLHHLPPHDDIKFFWLQGLFKKYFCTRTPSETCNVCSWRSNLWKCEEKSFKKLSPAPVIAAAENGA